LKQLTLFHTSVNLVVSIAFMICLLLETHQNLSQFKINRWCY